MTYPPFLSNTRAYAQDGDRDNGYAGLIAPTSRHWSVANFAVTASQLVYCRFVPSRPMIIHGLQWTVTTAAGSDDAVDAGILDASLNWLASSGSTTGRLNAVGKKSVALTVDQLVLPRTVYYAAFVCGTIGSTAAQVMCPSYSARGEQLVNSTVPDVDCDFQNATFPIPTTAGAITTHGSGSHCPILFLIETP